MNKKEATNWDGRGDNGMEKLERGRRTPFKFRGCTSACIRSIFRQAEPQLSMMMIILTTHQLNTLIIIFVTGTNYLFDDEPTATSDI